MQTYNHRVVQDLAWVIYSETLPLANEFACRHTTDVHIPGSAWFNKQYCSLQDRLNQLDKNPYELQCFLSAQETFRLGFYYESLVHYWLSQCSQFEILFKNQTLSHNGITAGEFDFIIMDHAADRIIHLETAVKFYLAIKYNDQTYYVGPNLNDRYDKKLEKLFNHQLILSEHKAAEVFLAENNLSIDQRWLFLKGRLFEAGSDLITQHWITLSDFKKAGNKILHYIVLPRLFWLSELNHIEYNFLPEKILKYSDVIHYLSDDEYIQPVCIAQIKDNKETGRFFITPDNWEEKAHQFLNI